MRSRIVPLLLLYLFWTATTLAQTASFSADVTTGCSPLVVNFQDQSTGNPTSWAWDFGNGATSTLQNPSSTYFNEGPYTVKLTVSSSRGTNTITRTGYIFIYGRPSVKFIANDSVGCYPFRIQFTDQSSTYAGTTNVGWLWDFGNGIQATNQNPLNVYTHAGNYTVTLKVTNDKGCFGVYSKPTYIKVVGGIESDFSASQPNVCKPPFDINFTNNTTGPGTLSYLWDFGDGSTSVKQSPSHKYTKPGNYTVTLATTSKNGCSDTLSKINLLQIQDIKTTFTAPDSICFNSPVLFQNTSTPDPASSNWNFGDGTSSVSTNPIKFYNAINTYTVTLYNTYAYCSDSFTKKVKVLPRPKANFKPDNTFKCQPPFTVNFQDLSTNAVSWNWNFGDGSPKSTNQNPSHTYTDYGQFRVTLIVTNSSGCTDTLKKDSLIKIIRPVITFPGLPVRGCVPYPFNFSASINTLDNVTSYSWDFGDGSPKVAAQFPSHTYTVQGTYTVTLTITTSTGCTETYALSSAVMVGTKPLVDFSALPIPNCAFDPVNFQDLTIFNPPNGVKEFLWDFGDGSTAPDQNPAHKYFDTGFFNIKLVVINNGCPDSLTKTSYVSIQPPISKFSYLTDCSDKHKVTFTDQSIGAVTIDWDFGDGSPLDHSPNPIHVFAAYGDYLVTQYTHNGTCNYATTLTVHLINSNPDFTADTTVACKTATISFAATAPGGGVNNYSWDFGDGNIGISSTPKNTYNKSGYYNVTLYAQDYNNCLYTITKNRYIHIKGPTADFNSTNSKGCKGLTANFTDLSKDDGESKIVKWKWNFGDGTPSVFTNGNSLHNYPDSGTYTVKLNITDLSGCSDSLTIPDLVVATSPKANFVADTLACPGSSVFFNNLSNAINFSSSWTFGDGQASTIFSPTNSYAAPGKYTIKLVITDQYGCPDSMTKTDYIIVKKPVASFTLSDSISSCAPLQVNFTNTSQYYISSLWNLGGGVSSITNPVQYYVIPGNYPISLIVTSAGGCTDTAYNNIQLFDTVGSKVSYIPLNGCKPLSVDVTTFSKGPVSFTWDFGDGNVLNNASQKENHVYHSFGDFMPKVIMTDPSGCVIPVAGLDTIHIIGVTAKFGVDQRLFCDQGFVNFIDSTIYNDTLIKYTWDFGDGGTSNLHSPGHQYNGPGNYTVSLNVQTQNNCQDTFSLNNVIKVVQSPLISIGGDSIACINVFMQHIGVYNRPDTSAVEWMWNFPNGSNEHEQIPVAQQYNNAGQFVVTAVATNSSGCKDSALKFILIHPLPQVTLPSVITLQAGYPVTIPATYSSNVISYNWLPLTGLSCVDCPQPVTEPKFNTKYVVSFIDSNGCRNTGQVQIIVICKNANIFVPNTFSPNGDGINDIFYVRGRGLDRVKSLRIFNRWGQIVFEQTNFPVNDPLSGWNGKFKGNKPIPDVYVYQLEVFCENSQIIHIDGNIALIQ